MQHINIFTKSRWLVTIILLTTLCIGQMLGDTYNFSSLPTKGWSTSGGSQTINGKSWTYSSSTYIGNSSSKIQVGSGSNPQGTNWTIQTAISNFGSNKKITAVAITGYATQNASYSSYDISVGGSSVKSGSFTASSATYTADNLNVTSGNIVVTLRGATGTNSTKALYLSNISVTYETVTASCTATPTIGAASLNGSFSLSSVGVSCASSGAGANCSITKYGWVWSDETSSMDPVINGTGVTKHENSGAPSGTGGAFTGTLSGTFQVGHTYYYKAYVTNGKPATEYSTVQSFTPRQITFYKNDGTSTTSTQIVKNGVATNLTANSFSRTGYTFIGWNTQADGKGTDKANQASVTVSGGNLDLYAKWNVASYTIGGTLSNCEWSEAISSPYTYDGATNAIERTVNPSAGYICPSSITVTMGGSTLSSSTDYTWSVSAGVGSFTLKKAITGNVVINITAQPIYTVTLDPGTGSLAGSNTLTQASYNANVTLPTPTAPNAKWTFAGWAESEVETATSTAPTLISAGNYQPTKNITLYAVYQKGDGKYHLVTTLPTGTNIPGTYVIANTTSKVALEAAVKNTNYLYGCSISQISNGEINPTDITADYRAKSIWEVTYESSKWIFYNSNTSKYLYNYASGNNHYVGLSTSKPSGYTIALNNDGFAVLTSADDNGKHINWVSSYSNFASGDTENLHLYKLDLLYFTNPCTELDAIEGSVSWSNNGTSATISWPKNANVSAWELTCKQGSTSKGSIGELDATGANNQITISNLTAGESYDITLSATTTSGNLCTGLCGFTPASITAPKITLSDLSGDDMTYAEGHGPSNAKTFTVSGVGLTGDLTVTAPTNFEVSLDNTNWASSKTITASGTLSATTVYVRLAAEKTYSADPYAGNVIVSGGSAADQTKAVSATVTVSCHTPSVTDPTDATYNLNETATALSAAATKGAVSDPDLTYQWYVSATNDNTAGEAIENETSDEYSPATTTAGTKYYYCVVNSGACEKASTCAKVVVNTPTITVSETALAFSTKRIGSSYEMSFTVEGTTLAKDANVALAFEGDGQFVIKNNVTSLTATNNAVATTEITVVYTPTVGNHSATITISSTGATNKTVALSGIGYDLYTVTLNAGNGEITADGWTAGSAPVWTKTQTSYQEAITLPAASCNCSGWEFVGWKQGSAVNNASSFSADKASGASVTPAANTTYYAVYRQSAPSGTTYNKITSTDDLTTGNYLFISTYPAAMQNTISNNHTGEVTSSIYSSNASNTTSNTAIIWTIVKIGDYYAINNGSDFLGTDADGNISLSTTPHLFTATYNTTNSRWEFTSATYTSKQLIYNSYFKIGESQSSAIYLYKQAKTPTGNFYTNPSCTSYDVTGAASPVAGGSVQLTASTAVAGDKVWAYCAPTSGYKFKNWEVSGTGAALSSTTAQLTQVTVGSANVELTANVGLLYSITLTSGGELANGTIEADLSSACAGETVTLTATPNEHFTFSSWSVTKTGEPGTTVTVTDNQFTMPAYAVTVNATFAEAPFRTVVFKNNNAPLFDDGGDAELYDATNKWKQKVYVGDEPVWPTSLTSSEKIDANSNIFYGWTATAWEGKVASKSTIDDKAGAEKVYTDDFTGATVAAGEGEVVYYAVWSKETEGNNFELVTDGSKLKAGDAYLGSYINYSSAWRYFGATSNSAMQNITVSGTPKTLSSTTGLKKVTFVATSTSGQFQIKDGTKYLYANGAGSAPTWSDNACAWTFSNKDANNLFQVVSSLGTYYLRAYATSTTVGALKMYGNTTNSGICVFQKGTSYGDFITTCHTISGASTSGTAVEYDGDETTITSSHNQAFQGTQITLTVPTASHYTFSSWIVKDESNNDVTVTSNKFTMPASDVTVTATWTPKPYSLTVSEPTNGSIAFDGVNAQYTAQDVNYHTAVTLTATPADEYYFAGWTISPSIDGVLTTSPELSFSMPGVATTISASFAAVVYPSLTLNEDNLSGSSALSATLANGTAIADMSSIKAGTELKVTYTPDGQKELTGWTLTKEGGGDVEYVEDGNTITFNMPNANLTVAANGEQNYYTLDLAATNGSISSVKINDATQELASSYIVHEGEMIEIDATAEDNTYKFKEWQKTNIAEEDIAETGTNAIIEAGTSNMTLTAIFEPKAMYNVTLKAMDKTQEVIANKLEGTSIWSIVRYKTAPNLTDYAFQGWCTDVNNASTTMITELADATLGTNITLHAVYSKKAVYRKVTSDAGLADGDYLIVYEGGDKAFNGGLTTLDATFNTIDVEISDDYTIASNETTDAAKFTLKEITGGYSIKSASNLYIDRSTNSNGLEQGENEVANSVSINGSENVVIYGSFGSTGRNLSFNTASDQQRFRYMGNTSNIQLYKKEAAGAATPTPTDVVADEEELEILVNKTLGNLVVENGGSVTVASGKTLTVNDLTIESMAGKSGQLTGSGSVTVNGNIYMDVKFYGEDALDATSANQWYMISAPFDVNLADGFINPVTGATMHRGNDDNVNTFDLFEYDGEKRATTGTTGWKRVSGKMTAGTACLIGFNPGQPTTIRLKAASNTISDPESISLASNESSVGETDQEKSSNSDWNGIANPRMRYTNVNKDVYVWDNEEGTDLKPGRKYTVFSSSQYSFVVGTPFFVQAAGENDAINFSNATHSGDYLRAPKREVNERIEYCVRITREGANDFADQMYVRASEEASATYERGHDLIAWNGTNGKSALLWSENYGMRLAIEEAPLANNGATYVLGLYAPADGVYTISTPTEDEDATLYLTLNGHIIWNLSQGAYTAELQQGQNSGYGLKIVAAPKVSTDVEQSVVSDQPSVQKVIIDEHVYILRGGQMYDVNGKMVK